ncbi:MAG: hypothetical protein M1363_03905 [Gammaproteobacteria bacterium]|nr:hypothetical protein [Gammaproteobacteria bacterium]
MHIRPYQVVQGFTRFIILISISVVAACGGSPLEEDEINEKNQLVNPDWLVNANVQLNFVEDSYDLDWKAFGFYSSTKEASALTFEYGPTPTLDSDIPVQWNLTWINGFDGAGYATPFILYKVSGLVIRTTKSGHFAKHYFLIQSSLG